MKKFLKSKKLLFLIAFAAIVGIFTHEYLLSNATVHIKLEISSQEDGQVQLYFYSGNEVAPFDESHTMVITFYGADERQSIDFTLSLARLRMVRFDIDGAQSAFIHGISMSYLGKQTQFQYDSNTIAYDCDFTITDDGAQFVRTADDPRIQFGDLRYYNLNVLYISLTVAGVVAVLVHLLLRFLKRRNWLDKYYRYRFLFEELVKRDFKKKYKRTILGMLWSMLNPLLMLLVMWVVFKQFFGQTMNHYVIFLFAGNIVFSFFSESTNVGMNALVSNAGIFTKVNVPKYIFILSQSVTSLINFGLTLIIFFLFTAIEGIPFTFTYFCLIFPVVCLMIFNIGIGMILSALCVFFRDIEYLWSILSMLIMYLSAIFYNIDGYSETAQNIFLLNPVYVYIRYFRKIVLEDIVPSPWFHLLALGYAVAAIGVGCLVYKKENTKFLYYV